MFINKYLSKYVFQSVNLFCFIFGVGILCIAYFMDRKLYTWSAFVDSELTTVPQVLTTVGLVLLVIAVVCMCSTLKNIKYRLIMVSVLVTILLIGEYMLGSVVYHMCSNMEQYALERMKYTISTYNKTGHEATRQSWNTLQSNIECCGIDGPKDWKPVTSSGELPASCCYAVQIDQSCTEINSYTIGCFEKFKTNLEQNNRIILWSAVGFALVQIFAVFLAFYCKCSIVHEDYEKI